MYVCVYGVFVCVVSECGERGGVGRSVMTIAALNLLPLLVKF